MLPQGRDGRTMQEIRAVPGEHFSTAWSTTQTKPLLGPIARTRALLMVSCSVA
jgi:hypothetical protein